MPWRWTEPADEGAPERSGAPSLAPERRLELWPHRSLSNRGFAAFILATAAMLSVPLLVLLGHPAVWVILPFMGLALAGTWLAIRRSDRDARLVEVLTLAPDRLRIVRREPGGRERSWEANPYWVRLRLYAGEGPVPNYLTLRGGGDAEGREVEIGAFLSAEERLSLKGEIEAALAALR
ncbi:MAG: DUF2244 domain-containing protein [Rhodobacteraceae bacterium]|nr:DUF2244 domain-containing protein [Paracoccaceae bacterium]